MEVRKYVRIILNIVMPLLSAYLIVVWGVRILAFFAPFAAGWIIAMVANPVVRFLENRIRIVRKHGSFVLITGVLALIVFAVYVLAGWTVRGAGVILKELPEIYGEMEGEVVLAYENLKTRFQIVSPDMETAFVQMIDKAGAAIGEMLPDLTTSAGGAVARTLPDILVSTVVVLLSSYFFLAEHDRISAKIWELLPDSAKKYLRLMKQDVREVIGGYFMAQFRIMFVVALLLMAGFWILGIGHSVLLAVLIAILDFLPMFGTGTALIPWALLKLFTGEWACASGLLLLYVVTQAARQLIQPKIVGDSIGLPPLTTLFLLFIGYRFQGLTGMILAVPVGMVVIKLYGYGIFDSLIANGKLLLAEIERLRKE